VQLKSIGKQHVIEYHHIFPKALLKAAHVDGPEVNEIANLAFITSATNKWLGKRPPSEYVPEIIAHRGEETLKRHFIPLDPELWKLERFRDFLAARRVLLAEAMNVYLTRARGPQTPVRSV
jgi:hypothetical protein